MERGFLSQKRSGGGRGVKENNQVLNNVSAGDVVIPLVVDEPVLSSLDGPMAERVTMSGNSSGTQDGNVDSPSTTRVEGKVTPISSTIDPDITTSYAKLFTGKSSKKSLNFRTLITLTGNRADVVIPLESIKAISEPFVNTAYSFFLGKWVAYPFSSMDGLDAMLENGRWFIRNNPLILNKLNLDVNLLKEDVDQVLSVLKNRQSIGKPTHSMPCEVCHHAKQVREPFPLSEHKSDSLGSLIHLDLWEPYKVTTRDGFKDVKFYETIFPYKISLEKDKCLVKDSYELKVFSENDDLTSHKTFFDDFQTDSQASSPNDDGGEPSGSNIGFESKSDDTVREQSSDDDQGSVQIGEEDFSEGNVFENNDVPTNLFNIEESNTGRSYKEAALDKNLVQAMNEEIEVLYENNSWDLVELPKNRKAIRSKWVYKIKHKSRGEINRYKARSLYGLKQAPRQWNNRLSEALVENDFKQSGHDHSLYTKESGGSFIDLLVYVDDIVLTGNDINEINKVKIFLKSKFMIKDLELLHDYRLLACKPVSTPLPENIILAHKESEDDKFLKNITSYQRLVGKLIYLTLTRPDISYSVHYFSQHMQAPLQSHMDLGLKVLRYLKGTPGSGVNYEKSEHMSLKVYADSDWAKCHMTRRSVSGYCVFFNGCMVSWKSKKQDTLSKFSAEAKYRSMAAATCELMWVVNILKDLKVKNLLHAELFCDNSAAIQIAANPLMHEKTKHFDLDVHIIREKVALGLIKTTKTDFENQIADIFTKALGFPQHSFYSKKVDPFEHVAKVAEVEVGAKVAVEVAAKVVVEVVAKMEAKEVTMEMEPHIENMKLEEYLRYESEKECQLWKSVRSKGRTTRYKKKNVDSFYRNWNEEPNENDKEVDIDNMNLEEYKQYELAMSKRKSKVDIGSVTIEEYELYMAMQCSKTNEVHDPTHGVTSQLFDQSPHTPNPPLDKKDLSLEEILDDLFRIGADNLRRMEQEEVQNVCDDKESRETDQENGDLLNFLVFPFIDIFANVCEQVVENINVNYAWGKRKFMWMTLQMDEDHENNITQTNEAHGQASMGIEEFESVSVESVNKPEEITRLVYHDLYLGRKALVERENVGFDLTKSYLYPSLVEGHTVKGVRLRVMDSHIGEAFEPEGRLYLSPLCSSIQEGKIVVLLLFIMSAKNIIRTQTWILTKEELSEFLSIYPVPSKYKVMLPKRNQTIFGPQMGTLYFHVNLSRLNPFGCAKLTTFVVMCKAYGCEPSMELFRGFFNLFPGGWKADSSLFKTPLCLSIVQSFCPNIIGDEDLSFLPKEPSLGFGIGSPSVSINNEAPLAEVEPLDKVVIHAGSVARRIKDRKCRTRGSSKPSIKHRLDQGGSSSRATRQKTSPSKADSPFLTISNDEEGLPDVLELQDANACHRKISNITRLAWRGHLDNQLNAELLDLHDRCYAKQAIMDNAVNRKAHELLKVVQQMKGECDLLKEREKAKDKECEDLKAKCKAAMSDFNKNTTINVLRKKIASLSGEVKELKLVLKGWCWREGTEASLRQEVKSVRRDREEVVSKVVPSVAMELV
ncbi:ribonuclease H-like domain-containing protein [Tanacetum coccineum]